MSLPGRSATSSHLSEGQKQALVKLLADDDPSVYRTVRRKLLSLGEEGMGWIEEYLLSNDPVVRRRVTELVAYQRRQRLDNEFLGFCLSQGEELDLECGMWLLASTRYALINETGYRALLDHFAAELEERLGARGPDMPVLPIVNDYLFKELRFSGNEEDYYDPENSYFNRVLDRRTGNPISLCLLYVFLGRRLRLPIAGIGMPGHFLCRYQTSTEEIYIDAFNRGRLLTRGDCVKYLLQTSQGFQESYLAPVTARRVLLRVCSNLHHIYSQLEQPQETARFQRYIVALAK